MCLLGSGKEKRQRMSRPCSVLAIAAYSHSPNTHTHAHTHMPVVAELTVVAVDAAVLIAAVVSAVSCA